jgi:hypothetical protein
MNNILVDPNQLRAEEASLAVRTIDFVSKVYMCETIEALDALFCTLVTTAGIDAWSFSRVSTQPHARIGTIPGMFGRCPVLWNAHYCRRDYMAIDPVVAHLLCADRHYLWSQAQAAYTLDAAQKRIAAEAADFGLKAGLVVPFRSWDGSSYCQSAFKSDPGSASNFDPLFDVLWTCPGSP